MKITYVNELKSFSTEKVKVGKFRFVVKGERVICSEGDKVT